MTLCSWSRPPRSLVLCRLEVHVWRVGLNRSPWCIDALLDPLNEDERARAAAFRRIEDRNHYIACRGTLRGILGHYLRVDPGEICFQYNPFGKPALGEPFCRSGFQFNVSHSGEIALLAFTLDRSVGIDVEVIRNDLQLEEMAAACFSSREVSELRSLPDPLKCLAFYNCWTRKEAYIKARGEGLSMALDRFNVTLTPGAAKLSITVPESEDSLDWSLCELHPGHGCVAAMVVEGSPLKLNCWEGPS